MERTILINASIPSAKLFFLHPSHLFCTETKCVIGHWHYSHLSKRGLRLQGSSLIIRLDSIDHSSGLTLSHVVTLLCKSLGVRAFPPWDMSLLPFSSAFSTGYGCALLRGWHARQRLWVCQQRFPLSKFLRRLFAGQCMLCISSQ